MNLRITFTGHINERVRPEGFPKTVSCFIEKTNTSPGEFREVSNFVASQIAAQGIMICPRDDKEMKNVVGNSGQLAEYDRNIMVPLHMITHITSITEEFPDPLDLEDELKKVKIN